MAQYTSFSQLPYLYCFFLTFNFAYRVAFCAFFRLAWSAMHYAAVRLVLDAPHNCNAVSDVATVALLLVYWASD